MGALTYASDSMKFKLTVLPPLPVPVITNGITVRQEEDQADKRRSKFIPSSDIRAVITKISIKGKVNIAFQQQMVVPSAESLDLFSQ